MGVNKDTETAGPGKRLEFFTKGCIRGVVSPCQGCFNESTWTFEGNYRALSQDEVVEIALESAWNRQVTFCGGEPILQGRQLADIARRLKEIDSTFHFVMYTAYKLDTLLNHGLSFTWVQSKHGDAMYDHLMDYCADYSITKQEEDGAPTTVKFTILKPQDILMITKYIDLIVDGDYQMDKRLTTDQYMHEGWFVGSSNQRVIDGPKTYEEDELVFMYADEYNEMRATSTACVTCGKSIFPNGKYCSSVCAERHSKRTDEVERLGV